MTPATDYSTTAGNIVDRAAQSADTAIDATRRGANAAIDSMSDKVHAVRDAASPALNRLTAPLDTVVARTQEAPIQSLLLAALTGAALMALASMLRSSR